MDSSQFSGASLPRVAITYCTQCRWMLRAAYFAQELLSTFQGQLGEVALIPATGGRFTVDLTYHAPTASSGETEAVPSPGEPQTVLIWDRKAQGGFPETKVLKQLVRDHIDPGKHLGHSDRHKENKDDGESKGTGTASTGAEKAACEDCH